MLVASTDYVPKMKSLLIELELHWHTNVLMGIDNGEQEEVRLGTTRSYLVVLYPYSTKVSVLSPNVMGCVQVH